MKHVDGDLDDLFRRASERYPLREDGADWDRLANALDKDPEPPSDNLEDNRGRRGLFWWFLLMPLAGLGYLTWQMGAHHSSEKGIVAASVGDGVVAARSGRIAASVTGAGQVGSAAGSGNARQSGSAVGGGIAGQAGSSVGGENGRKVRKPDVADADAGGFQGSQISGGSAGEEVRTSQNGTGSGRKPIHGTQGGDQSILGAGKVRKMRTGNTGGREATGLNGSDATGLDGTGSAGGSTGVSIVTGGTRTMGSGGDVDHDPALALLDLRRAPIGGGYNVVVDVVAPKAAAADNSVPPVKKQSRKGSHGYIGILGAPDFSTVKYQSMKGVGTTFGLLLGYSFNDRWAVETGLYLDRKRYYTEGEYFNTKALNWPPGYNLLNVDGTCYMWEIPLNIRYNFNKSERMKWFATAGLSTYLMTKESYSYQYTAWSGGPTDENDWKFKTPSQYWFSIVNLSAGYEQRLGKIGNLRLEPYVRLPLSGIGTGRLPIMSAGLNIGFTRRLW